MEELVKTVGAERRCELVLGPEEVADEDDGGRLPALPATVFGLKSLNFLQGWSTLCPKGFLGMSCSIEHGPGEQM